MPQFRVLWIFTLFLLSVGSDARAAMYKVRVRAHWLDDGSGFWYRNDLKGVVKEYIFVDAERGTRKPAFDSKRLTAALEQVGVKNLKHDRLALDSLDVSKDRRALSFRLQGKFWSCDLESYELTNGPKRNAGGPRVEGLAPLTPEQSRRPPASGGESTEITFVNRTESTISIYWRSGGRRVAYGTLAAGKRKAQHTYAGHLWDILDSKGTLLAVFQGSDSPDRAIITGRAHDYSRVRRRSNPRRRDERRRPRDVSPDGRFKAFVRDGNVFVREEESKKEAIQLSKDGSSDHGYDMLDWAGDSKTLVAFRIQRGENKQVHLVQSSPKEGGRAKLRSRGYALPGDRFTSYDLVLFDVEKRESKKPKVDASDFGRPRVRWRKDRRRFTYEKYDRGHQRYRLIEVDTRTGMVRNVIDEKSETFIWSAHTEHVKVRRVTWLEKSDEILYVSEKDGWRHLYLLDAQSGELKARTTHGEFVVRSVERIDEEKRQIWFRGSGRNPGQ
ncbi:MAG: DPP IV N-terminal domain-containing protein, partial [Planctomycetota bacterium]